MTKGRTHFSRHSFLEHEADIGVRGEGDCWPCAFSAASAALLELMADPSSVEPEVSRRIGLEAGDIGALFVSWLNELLYLRDAEDLLFSWFDISIEERSDGRVTLEGFVRGQRLSAERHGLKTEVKAATYSGLRYGEEEGVRFVQCLLDL